MYSKKTLFDFTNQKIKACTLWVFAIKLLNKSIILLTPGIDLYDLVILDLFVEHRKTEYENE